MSAVMRSAENTILLFAGILFAGILMGGCSAAFSGVKPHDWVGHHRDEVIQAFGPPTQEAVLGQGGKSLVYVRQNGSPNRLSDHLNACRVVFNTDSRGIVKSWAFYSC
jgi:hypothetical protein